MKACTTDISQWTMNDNDGR